MRKIDFAIIGAQKSGSTYIHRYLKSHPKIMMPEGEVTCFELYNLEELNVMKISEIIIGSVSNKLTGMKRPNLYTISGLPQKMHNYNPKIKLILVLRNPVDRVISAYFHRMKNGKLPIINIGAGVNKLLNRKSGDDYDMVVKFGLYHKYLSKYLKYFSKRHFLFLTLDELSNNPSKTMKKLCSFLDIAYVNKLPTTIPQKGIYSLTRLKLWQLRNLIYYKKFPSLHKREHYSFFQKLCLKLIYGLSGIIEKIDKNKKPKLSTDMVSRLTNIYRKDVDSLSKLINKDLSSWL